MLTLVFTSIFKTPFFHFSTSTSLVKCLNLRIACHYSLQIKLHQVQLKCQKAIFISFQSEFGLCCIDGWLLYLHTGCLKFSLWPFYLFFDHVLKIAEHSYIEKNVTWYYTIFQKCETIEASVRWISADLIKRNYRTQNRSSSIFANGPNTYNKTMFSLGFFLRLKKYLFALIKNYLLLKSTVRKHPLHTMITWLAIFYKNKFNKWWHY